MPTGSKDKIDISDVRIAFVGWRSAAAPDHGADGKNDQLRTKDGETPTIPPGYAPL